MTVNVLTEHHSEFLSFKVGCTGSSESTLVKMPHVENHMLRLICHHARVPAFMFFVLFSNTWPRGYKTFFVLNSTEHEISTAHKN